MATGCAFEALLAWPKGAFWPLLCQVQHANRE